MRQLLPFCYLLALLAGPAVAQAQTDDAREPRLRINYVDAKSPPEIRLFFNELDKLGNVAKRRATSKYRLRIDGLQVSAPLSLKTFEEERELLSLVIVLQLSPSMQDAMPKIVAGCERLLAALAGKALVGLVVFSDVVNKTVPLGLPAKVSAALKGLSSGDAMVPFVQIPMAVREGLELLTKSKKKQQRAVLLISDGLTEDLKLATFQDLGRECKEKQVLCHSIGHNPLEPDRLRTLFEMSHSGRGTYRLASTTDELPQMLDQFKLEVTQQLVASLKIPRPKGKSGKYHPFDGKEHDITLSIAGTRLQNLLLVVTGEAKRAVVPGTEPDTKQGSGGGDDTGGGITDTVWFWVVVCVGALLVLMIPVLLAVRHWKREAKKREDLERKAVERGALDDDDDPDDDDEERRPLRRDGRLTSLGGHEDDEPYDDDDDDDEQQGVGFPSTGQPNGAGMGGQGGVGQGGVGQGGMGGMGGLGGPIDQQPGIAGQSMGQSGQSMGQSGQSGQPSQANPFVGVGGGAGANDMGHGVQANPFASGGGGLPPPVAGGQQDLGMPDGGQAMGGPGMGDPAIPEGVKMGHPPQNSPNPFTNDPGPVGAQTAPPQQAPAPGGDQLLDLPPVIDLSEAGAPAGPGTPAGPGAPVGAPAGPGAPGGPGAPVGAPAGPGAPAGLGAAAGSGSPQGSEDFPVFNIPDLASFSSGNAAPDPGIQMQAGSKMAIIPASPAAPPSSAGGAPPASSGFVDRKTQIMMAPEVHEEHLVAWIVPLDDPSYPTIRVHDEFTLGSDANCHFIVDGEEVEDRHAILDLDPQGYWLRWAAMEKHQDAQLLLDNDRFRVGDREFLFKIARSFTEEPRGPCRLEVLDGIDQTRSLSLLDSVPYAIGSHPSCALTIRGEGVGPRHAIALRKRNVCFIEDLGAEAGVAFEGGAVGSKGLKSGQEIALGQVRLLFVMED